MLIRNDELPRDEQLKRFIHKTTITRDYLLLIVDQLNVSLRRSEEQLKQELEKQKKKEEKTTEFLKGVLKDG